MCVLCRKLEQQISTSQPQRSCYVGCISFLSVLVHILQIVVNFRQTVWYKNTIKLR